ncbi:GNAT family N-acetyltransferase [Paenibacillus sp. FSL W7-1287]|uniref:GNAT family N-acetyltransferase n=1 Tax=Paenibacillus sp. FSL W7-1287 TaxID=2954538 RepID=UPI0030FB7391
MFSYRIDDELQLTLLELRHAQELFELTDRNRTYLRQWLPWVDGTTTVDHTTWFIESTMQQFASNNGFQTAITYQGRIVGCIGLNGIAWGIRKTAIGYWLAADYQGKGMMTRSCRALVNYAFNELKLNRVEIRAAEFNKKSRAIPEKLGFVQEGIVRQEGWQYDHFIDLVIYGMLAEDWNVVK